MSKGFAVIRVLRLLTRSVLLVGVLTIVSSGPALALSPEEVVIVINKKSPASRQIGKHYRKCRAIPSDNIIYLKVEDQELCTREYYNKEIADPIREFLEAKDPLGTIKCIVTTSGIPLKVGPDKGSQATQERIACIRRQLAGIGEETGKTEEKESDKAGGKSKAGETGRLRQELARLEQQGTSSALDSELVLVLKKEYELEGWLPSPYFLSFRDRVEVWTRFPRPLMVSRLDGPDPKMVLSMINKGLQVERDGLQGRVYLDARGMDEGGKGKNGAYALYDESLRKTSRLFVEQTGFEVVLDNEAGLFKEGKCPGALFYCGWYRLADYQDSFDWVPGAVGYHIASAECRTLRKGPSRVWCKKMIEKGITATLGPVGEPYLQAFPLPHEFFRLFVSGRHTLAECFFMTSPYVSWMMILVGDPLYTPFQ